MLVTGALTVGQITFILRAAIQILSYGGLFLIGFIVLGSAPRVASLKTHDVLNRVVGKSTVTKASAKWMWNYFRGRNGDPVMSTRLLLSIALLTLYGVFVSVSDIGFLGFYACSVAGPSTNDFPSSINTDALARSAVMANLVNGTDPSTVKAYRCDSVAVVNFDTNVTERNCTAWHNSTYADASLFAGLNMTDSDNLMPRQLRHYDQPRSQYIDLNSYFLGPGTKRVASPTISGGMVVNPHETGVQIVFGVPQLGTQRKVALNKAMALEIDVGCMALGMYSQHDLDTQGAGFDIFATNGTWRKYTGPDYLQAALSSTADAVRQYYTPLYNSSSLDSSGFMTSINGTNAVLSTAAHVMNIPFTDVGTTDGSTVGMSILGNCTNTLRQQLNLTVLDSMDAQPMCTVLGIGGSMTQSGAVLEGQSKMLCATATQVNLVSATVQTDAEGAVTLNLTRLPSNLNYLRADYWDAMGVGNNTTQYTNFLPIERYTLSDNPSGPTSHYIVQNSDYSSAREYGPGSGGTAFSRAGTMMLDLFGTLETNNNYIGLTMLDDGNNPIGFNASMVTTWAGQVGASYILASASYNGWAARDSGSVLVASTGGKVATCYKPAYAIGFAPLVIAAVFVAAWASFGLITSAFSGTKHLEELYGGMTPYWGTVCPTLAAQDTILMWQNVPDPHLDVVSQGQPLPMNDGRGTALGYLKTAPQKE